MVLGRRIFWPAIPRFSTAVGEKLGLWGRLGTAINRRRWVATLGSFGVLGVLALGLAGNTGALREQDQFLSAPESVTGFTVLREHFPELGGQPLTVFTRVRRSRRRCSTSSRTPGVAMAVPEETVGGWANISVFPKDAPDTAAEYDTIKRVRTAVHAVSGAEAIVGGPSAENLDTEVTTRRDEKLVIPLVLAVVLIILGLLLRAVLAPLVLMATVVVSFAAAFGGSVFVFDTILGFTGVDSSVPLLAFLFLVALGVDYNIFLASRAREETLRLGTGEGMLKALSADRWRHHLGRPGPGGHVRGPRLTSAGDAGRGRFPGGLRRAARRPAGAVGPGARPYLADRPAADVVAEPVVPSSGGAAGRATAARRRARSPRCNGERGGTDEIRDGAPDPVPDPFRGPAVAALRSCARRGAGAGIAASCPGGEPRGGARPRGHRPSPARQGRGDGHRGPCGGPRDRAGGAAAGRSTRSSAPPRAERATVARPPWASTTRCTIDSPRPDPGNPGRCRHGRTASNTRGTSAASMPGPASSTSSTADAPSARSRTWTGWSAGTTCRRCR